MGISESGNPEASLLTAAQMRAAEARAIEAGTAGGTLMARAVAGVVAVIDGLEPRIRRRRPTALVLCGPGNNGGDGYGVAAALWRRGWAVRVQGMGAADRLPPDAAATRADWETLGAVAPLDAFAAPQADLLVDALFGTGLTRPLAGAAADWPDRAARAQEAGACVLAVDLPSGLCSDSGRALDGAAIRADHTVTFHRRRPGHVLADGAAFCGRVHVADIGLDPRADAPDAARLISGPAMPLAKAGGHKYDHGHALVLTGGAGRTGAARLAARAALRVGAGLVTLGAPGSALLEVAGHVTAAMLRRVDDADALEAALADRRMSALCLGPGLGSDRAAGLLPGALASGRRCVLDADALTAFAAEPDRLFGLLHSGCVLTPHDGEFARLFPDLAAPLREPARTGPAPSRIDATRMAAARAGCTVVLKGPDTVVASPDRLVALHDATGPRAVPQLASAGTGDVLAGLVTGLLARGAAPDDAACTAVWLHAEAGRKVGPGLVAEDLPEAIPSLTGG